MLGASQEIKKWRDRTEGKLDASWLFKLKEQSISDKDFISDSCTGGFYVDKISIFILLIVWTLVVLQGPSSLQMMSYMHILALKMHKK